jgi:hypothetical protein
MAKFSNKMMGKEVGSAEVYAPPHDMQGRPLKIAADNPKRSASDNVNMSVGNINRHGFAEPKTSGIKIRGTGCATKGVMARGPMG